MRVITGKARGMRLNTPSGLSVRPTTEKVKEAIFSALQFELEGKTVLDLFAGSGQMGIEAISRGAKRCIFVDSSAKSIEIIKENLAHTKLEEYSQVVIGDSFDFIRTTAKTFDIIILDPPYKQGNITKVLPFVCQKLNDGGVVVCEYESSEEKMLNLSEVSGLSLRKVYLHGSTNISILEKTSNREADDKNE